MEPVPNREQAIIDPGKISNYLLSGTHPVGRVKAQFFKSFGFREEAPEELTQALLAHVQEHPAANIEVSPYGTKYRVEGLLTSPDGRNLLEAAVWIILDEDIVPRFVTAFPC
jgi:hypothetical protein